VDLSAVFFVVSSSLTLRAAWVCVVRPRLSERLSPSADVRSEFWLCIRWWCDPHYAVSPGPHPQALSIRVRAVAQERVIVSRGYKLFLCQIVYGACFWLWVKYSKRLFVHFWQLLVVVLWLLNDSVSSYYSSFSPFSGLATTAGSWPFRLDHNEWSKKKRSKSHLATLVEMNLAPVAATGPHRPYGLRPREGQHLAGTSRPPRSGGVSNLGLGTSNGPAPRVEANMNSEISPELENKPQREKARRKKLLEPPLQIRRMGPHKTEMWREIHRNGCPLQEL